MAQLLRRRYWVVRLVMIALLALVVAHGVDDALTGVLFAPPAHDGLDARGDDDVREARWGRVAVDEPAAARLSARDVFGVPLPAPPPTPIAPTPVPSVPSGGELAATSLAVELVGTFVSEAPESSVATLRVAGESRLARRGSEVLGGAAKVVSIAPRLVILEERNGVRTVLRLWDADGAGASGSASPVAGPVAAPPKPPAGALAWVRETSPGTYAIDRSGLDVALKDPAALHRDARAVPAHRDNAYRGLKLVGVRPGGVYRALGLRSGDVLTAVNGQALDSPVRALTLFEELRSASSIALQIERHGRPRTLHYAIR